MKIFSYGSDTSITGYNAKVIETHRGFLLNTQYYTKENLSPVPFQSAAMYSSSYSLMTYKSMMLTAYEWYFLDRTFGIITDKDNDDISYINIQSGLDGSSWYGYIHKIQENDNREISRIFNVALSAFQFQKFMFQDDNYIYYTLRTNITGYFRRTDKITGAETNMLSSTTSPYSYPEFVKIYENDTNLIFTAYISPNIVFYNFYKNTNSVTTSGSIRRGTGTNMYYTCRPQDSYEEDTKHGTYYINAENTAQPIEYYYFYDGEDGEGLASIQSLPVAITWTGGITEIPWISSNVAHVTYYSFISEFNGIKYFNLILYVGNYGVNIRNGQGVYTFRINSATSFTFTGYNQVDAANIIGGCIYDESKEHLIIAKNRCFEILKFNQNTLRYESTGYDIPQCYSVGIDELQRIWYEKTDGTVDMINLEDAQSVTINFENPYYDYLGVAINTYIEFSALNYLNEEMTGTFELTISGPAVFTENNSNVLNFVYNGNGIQQIGVTITGASSITIYPKFLS